MRWFALILLSCLITSCAKRSTISIGELQENDIPFSEWIKQDFNPEPPHPVGFKSPDEWTSWNRFWFASAIGATGLDLVSTNSALQDGCVEANPLLGDSIGSISAISIGTLAAVYLLVEYAMPEEQRQTGRNWIYAAATVAHGFAGIHNMNVRCE